MKLLGVEFTDFACFDKQWVPLHHGINLVVGGNNSGKTALLKAIAALSMLPDPKRPRIPVNGYLRKSVLNASIYFQKEKDDPSSPLILQAQADWRQLLDSTPVLMKFSYQLYPEQGLSQFVGSYLVVSGSELSVVGLRQAQTQYLRHCQYEWPGLNQKLLAEIPIQGGSFGPAHFGKMDRGFDEGLLRFKESLYVDPHRTARPTMNLGNVKDLDSTASVLAAFLFTLKGRDPKTFNTIEKFITAVFPEFEFLIFEGDDNNQNQTSIKLMQKASEDKIPLQNCGTGVEQMLALATFVLCQPPTTVLLDEPHSFLHPSAERRLIDFLRIHDEHSYVISTHSAVMLNSVPSSHVTYVAPPGEGFNPERPLVDFAETLSALGYRNSDFYFFDRLIFVEGESDREILPILLRSTGKIPEAKLERTGFPLLLGSGTSISRYEDLLESLGRGRQPRAYLFDGDQISSRGTLGKTKNPSTGEHVLTLFLPKSEIEAYLLVPEAIQQAMAEQAGRVTANATLDSIQTFLAARSSKKPSDALSELYYEHQLRYHKETSGKLIAKHIALANQPEIAEIAELLGPVFEQF